MQAKAATPSNLDPIKQSLAPQPLVGIPNASHHRLANDAPTTAHSLVTSCRSDQGLLNIHQEHSFSLEASAIKQVHKAIATSQSIEPDASPSSEVVLGDPVVLYLKSVDQSISF